MYALISSILFLNKIYIDNETSATPNFSMDGEQIEVVAQTKYLGDIFDKYLCLENYIKCILITIFRALGLLKHSKQEFLPQVTLSKLYRSRVELHFHFNLSVWGCCDDVKLQI